MGFSFGNIANALGGGGGGTINNLASTVVGNLPIPGAGLLGGLAGSVLGGIGNMFGGGPGSAPVAGAFAGKHAMGVESLDDSLINKPDQETYIRLADQGPYSVEAVSILMAAECERNNVSPQQMWDGYAAGGSNGLYGLIDYSNQQMDCLIERNSMNIIMLSPSVRALINEKGGCKIIKLKRVVAASPGTYQQTAPAASSLTGQLGQVFNQPLPGNTSGFVGLPALIQQSAPVPSSQSLTGQDWTNIGTGILNGAISGGTKAALDTKEGQVALNQGVKSWTNENGLLIGGVGAVLACGFTYLLATRKR